MTPAEVWDLTLAEMQAFQRFQRDVERRTPGVLRDAQRMMQN
jgi:hypothetical protein